MEPIEGATDGRHEDQPAKAADVPRMSRRQFLCQAGAAAAGALLSGCAPLQPQPGPPGDEEVRLV